MQTVVETPSFQKAATKAGLSQEEIETIVSTLARNPDAGDVIKGSGGCRKVRVAGRGKGKSGGYRVITFYGGLDIPVFLLTVYSKGDVVNLTDAQINAMKLVTKTIMQAQRRR
jgi:hypothetical protein